MTNLKHTPAPWLVEGTTVYALEHNGWRKGVEQLCNRFTVSISGNPRTTSKEELNANARLISATPELLEALRDLYSQVMQAKKGFGIYDSSPSMDKAIYTTEAAITKATGEQA